MDEEAYAYEHLPSPSVSAIAPLPLFLAFTAPVWRVFKGVTSLVGLTFDGVRLFGTSGSDEVCER